MRDKILSRLGFEFNSEPLQSVSLLQRDEGTLRVEKVVYYSEPEIYVPGLLFLPKTPGPHPAVVFVNEGGKAADGIVDNYLRPLAEAGHVVFSIDPRGMGETDPMAPRSSKPAHFKDFVHDDESDFYYNSLRVGKTPLGQRVLDVTKAIDYLASRKEVDGQRISAIGHGLGGLIVLYSAALDERVASAAATRSLLSYEAIVENELYTHRFPTFAPGLLRDFDLPEVAAMIAPRPLLLANPVDQVHRIAPPDDVEKTYQPAAAFYKLAGNATNLVQARPRTAKETAELYLKHLPR